MSEPGHLIRIVCSISVKRDRYTFSSGAFVAMSGQFATNRAVAQLGSALEWGSRGRGFKSRRPERIRCLIVVFHVYILRSSKTGRRYVGSCENLSERLRRHNLGHSKATRHGMPWTLVHSESFSSRAEAAKGERYYKSGLGRDELECLGLWCGRRGDRSRVQIPPARFFSNQ